MSVPGQVTWKEFWYDKPLHLKAASVVGVTLAVFHVYTALFGSLDALMQRTVHLGLGLLLVFLVYPAKGDRRKMTILDILPLFCVPIILGYVLLNYDWIAAERFTLITPLFWYEVVLGVGAILLVLEAARRVVSPGLLWVAVGFLLYPFVAPYLPTRLLRAAPSAWTSVIDFNYLSTGGIFGIPLGVSATEIALFIMFGAILMKSGGSTLLSNIAFSLAGNLKGGPAKVAVVGSTLFGMISGTSTGNVATIGSITIPMMKKTGYSPIFAASVEAGASVGGQMVPPVMGAAAFVMAAFSGIPYSTLIFYAIVPGLLYYLSLFFIIDLEARRLKLPKMKSEISAWQTIKDYGHMILPIVALIYMLIGGYSPRFAGGSGIVTAIAVAQLRRTTRMTFAGVLAALHDGAVRMLIVMVSCATAGIIIGAFDMTGLGNRLGSAFLYLSHGSLLAGLLLGCAAAFVLGLGLPTTPAYIVQATTVIPALIGLGLSTPAAHLFAFYYSCLAIITPPDASAAYTAAAIAGADAWKTGWMATRLVLVAFIVPFMFAYDPGLLLIGSVPSVVLAVCTACIGVFALAVGIEGYLLRNLAVWERCAMFASAFLLIAPGVTTTVVGFALLIFMMLLQLKGRTKWLAGANTSG